LITAVTPGTPSSPSRGRSCQSGSAIGPTSVDQFEDWYKLGEDCLERAVQARKSEDSDAWLLIAKDWLLLAAESDAAKQQPGTSPQR
jgi:hypothetical protein